MYNLWDNGCESYVYKPCVAHGKGMVYMSPIVTPTIKAITFSLHIAIGHFLMNGVLIED